MKILHVNYIDVFGGAARAAYRLHNGLLEKQVESKILVQIKSSNDYTIIGPESKYEKVLSKVLPSLDQLALRKYTTRKKVAFTPAWIPFSNILKKIEEENPDIVHLHWIGKGMMRIEEIEKIKKPIVWSLHDMWAFTGGCHYDEECGKYTTGCLACPVLDSQDSTDLSSKVFKRKMRTYQNIENITIVGLSKWLENCAKESLLLKDKKIVNLPNPINTKMFAPIEKDIAKSILNLPKDKKLVLFGAVNATTDKRKGFVQLNKALETLDGIDIELGVFGSTKPKEGSQYKFKTHYFGYLHDELSLQILYSAADVVVVPSLQEAFGQTASEAQSCQTPVVAFDATGLKDIVEHQKTGYLAQPFDPEDLAKGIEWVLNHDNYQGLCKNARNKVVDEFDTNVVVNQYVELYKNILANQQN